MNVGGPAQQITGLLAGLAQERFQHRLLIGKPDQGEEDWVALRAPWVAEDPRVIQIPSLVRPIDPRFDVRAYRAIRAQIREFRPDIVHTHTGKAGLVGRLAARHEKVRHVVHTYHGHTLNGYFGPITSTVLVRAEQLLARETDVLMSVGERVRDDLLEARIGTPGQYVVVPPGVTPPEVGDRTRARAALGIAEDAPLIAFVARLTGIKRPDRMLEVASIVARQRPDAVFLVAGGAEDGEVDQLRVAAREADVRFLGWVAKIGEVYAAADIVLLTSDSEGMPVSLIEAGMCGRPSVSTNVGSVAEVVLDGKTGRVVASRADALAGAVLELIADPDLRRKYGDAARRHTLETFSMSRLVTASAQVYERILAGSSTACK